MVAAPAPLPMRAWADVAWIALLLCLIGLIRDNVSSNELTKFTDAMYYADPSWVPGLFPSGPDPGRRQWLYQLLASPLLAHGGFLFASLVGRLAAYLLLAAGLASVKRALGLRMLYFAPVVVLLDRLPSMAAGEWITWGVEPKVFSYGLILLALGPVLRGTASPLRTALLLGLATSLHVLVGLYAALAIAPLQAVQARSRRSGAASVVLFLLASSFALRPVFVHLLQSASARVAGELPASFIYVFLRAPHHLDPASWPSTWWLRLTAYVLLLAFSYIALRRSTGTDDTRTTERRLLIFAAVAMLPFVAGLAVAPFDREGRLLQYYPFRFGDVMLPFATCVMVARLGQHLAGGRAGRLVTAAARAAVTAMLALLLYRFAGDARLLLRFPGPAQDVSQAWLDCTSWIRANTPPEALFIAPPRESATFPWLARRRMLGTFKQVTLSGGLQEWHRRMSNLAATDGPWPVRGWQAAEWIAGRYRELDTAQVRHLMGTYNAACFLTAAGHRVDLPCVYTNESFALYTSPQASAPP